DQLRGALATVAAIPVTPFGPDGQVDWDAHARLIRRIVDSGVRLVTPNGNTGEFYALTAAATRGATESDVRGEGGSGHGKAAARGRTCWPGSGMIAPARSKPGGTRGTPGYA